MNQSHNIYINIHTNCQHRYLCHINELWNLLSITHIQYSTNIQSFTINISIYKQPTIFRPNIDQYQYEIFPPTHHTHAMTRKAASNPTVGLKHLLLFLVQVQYSGDPYHPVGISVIISRLCDRFDWIWHSTESAIHVWNTLPDIYSSDWVTNGLYFYCFLWVQCYYCVKHPHKRKLIWQFTHNQIEH